MNIDTYKMLFVLIAQSGKLFLGAEFLEKYATLCYFCANAQYASEAMPLHRTKKKEQIYDHKDVRQYEST